jgi:hypothetical protein
MAVLADISLDHVKTELKEASPYLEKQNIVLDDSMLEKDNLIFRVKIKSLKDEELYIAEFQCEDYREIPPYIEFIDPLNGDVGTKRAYPNVFHKKPCICARFNRKTYQKSLNLHNDWKYGDWQKEKTTNHLGGMISHIYRDIQSKKYKGRMG